LIFEFLQIFTFFATVKIRNHEILLYFVDINPVISPAKSAADRIDRIERTVSIHIRTESERLNLNTF